MDLASIVIPHYCTPDQLDLCLRCIDHYTDEPHETLVVDDGSGDETLASLRRREGRLFRRFLARPEIRNVLESP